MKNLLNFFNKKNPGQSTQKSVKKESETKQAKKQNDAKNGEVTPGHLFEHYNKVLIRPEDIINKLK